MVAGKEMMERKGSEDDMTVRMGRATKGGRREKGFRGREDTATKVEAETGTPPLTICLVSAEVYVVGSSSLLHTSSS